MFFLLGKESPIYDFSIIIENSVVSPTRTARNLDVTLDDPLSFAANNTVTARSCRFILHNIRRKGPFFTQEVAQVLVQALIISYLDYCNSLLAGVPACAIWPLQHIQNAAAEWPSTYPSSPTPHRYGAPWLLVAAYCAANGSGPSYIQDMVKPYTSTCPLSSASVKRLATPSLHGGHSHHSTKSRLFAVLAPQWWNELPIDIRSAETLHTFRRWLKTHLFRLHLGTWRKTNKKNKNTFYLSFFSNVALEAVWSCICIFLSLMYLHESCSALFISTWLNAFIVSRFG